VLFVAFLLALSASRAGAAVPSAANSTTPSCFFVCPFGDRSLTVIVRDFANNPIAGSTVALDFHNCPGAFLCSQKPSDPYVVDTASRQLRMVTGTSGSVTFPARVGGTGPPGSVWILADGVLLNQYALASPDQDGEGTVNQFFGPDLPLYNAKLGTTDPTADFDCSGLVDATDTFLGGQHNEHACFGFIDPVQKSTWGGLKLHYR